MVCDSHNARCKPTQCEKLETGVVPCEDTSLSEGLFLEKFSGDAAMSEV